MTGLNIHTQLGQILGDCRGAAALFRELGVECRYRMLQSLHDVCAYEGLDARQVLSVIMFWDVPLPTHERSDWSDAPLNELLDSIIAVHHGYLRRQLPRVQLLIDKAARDQGDQYPQLQRLGELFQSFRAELEDHMIKEENVIFPLIYELAEAALHPSAREGRVGRPLAELSHDFEHVEMNLHDLREMTQGFTPPPDACVAYQSLLNELANLEAGLQHHEYLEDRVLFPRAVALEQELAENGSHQPT